MEAKDKKTGEKVKATRAGARGTYGSDLVSSTPQNGKKLRKAGELKRALEASVIDIAEYTASCVEGLSATRVVAAGGERREEPDYPTRLSYLKFITETVEGMPVKRQEMVHRKIPSNEDLFGLLQRSPAFAREMRHVLDELEAKAVVAAPLGS